MHEKDIRRAEQQEAWRKIDLSKPAFLRCGPEFAKMLEEALKELEPK